MSLDDAKVSLQAVRDDVAASFDPALHESRLAQFHASLKTAEMALTHLYDEQLRHTVDPRAHAKAIGAFVPEA